MILQPSGNLISIFEDGKIVNFLDRKDGKWKKKKSTFFNELSVLILLFSEFSNGLSKNIQTKEKKPVKSHHMEGIVSAEEVNGRVNTIWSESQCLETMWPT